VTSVFQVRKQSPIRGQTDGKSKENQVAQKRLGLTEEKKRATPTENNPAPKNFLKRGSHF
jgi:hypothetical protein